MSFTAKIETTISRLRFIMTKFITFTLTLLLSQGLYAGKFNKSSCSLNGKKLAGKVQFVKNFPDVKVKVVKNLQDLKVKMVKHHAKKCGEWQVVKSLPDFKVQIVDNFPDVKIKYVDHLPGVK